MARHKLRGGDGEGSDFLGTMVASGVGAYAAKNATSMGSLLWTLAKYSLVILGILLVVAVIAVMFTAKRETFVPTHPSPEQDRKAMTPAGNVITY
jgi:hypothetical protein